jgi:hypothetical protein
MISKGGIFAEDRKPMVADEDIYRAAEALLKKHGEKAAMECATLADRWTQRGDPQASEVWKRVMRAIRKMQKQRPN